MLATFVVGTGVGVRRWVQANRRWRTTMPVVPIAAVTAGVRVKIRGRIEALDQTLHAPVSGRACVGYSAQLFAVGEMGVRHVGAEEELLPFVVRDDSGAVALVRPRMVDVVWSTDVERETGISFGEPAPLLLSFLERHRLPARGRIGVMHHYRFEEAALVVGETVAVVGTARLEPDPTRAANYREMASRAVFETVGISPLFVVDRADEDEAGGS